MRNIFTHRAAIGAMQPTRTGFAPDRGSLLAVVTHALTASMALCTIAAAWCLFDRPVAPLDAIPDYLRQSSLGFYDKSEARWVLFTFGVLWIALSVASTVAMRAWSTHTGKRCRPSVASAGFGLVLYFTCITLPPYAVDADHWFPFVAAATGIRAGDWPYLNGFDSSYGFIAPAAFAAWMSAFGLSSASLTALIAVSNLICGLLAFRLIRQLTGSRAAAFLGASILMLEATHSLAVTSTFRAPLQIMAGACFLWLSLRTRGNPLLGGVGAGVTALWNPPFGLFALAGFGIAHVLTLFMPARPQSYAARALAGATAGILLTILFVMVLHSGHLASISRIGSAAASASMLSLAGYGNIAQHFDPLVLPAALSGALLLATIIHRWQRNRLPSPRLLFAMGSWIAAAPYVAYAMGRADASHHLPLYWALLPAMALCFMAAIRMIARTATPMPGGMRAPGTRVLLTVALLALFPAQRFADAVGLQVTRYEPARERWYGDCAAGRGCDVAAKPSLANALRDALRPTPEADPAQGDPRLARACARGLVIVSFVDAWVYATSGCYSPIGVPTLALINTRDDLRHYLDLLATQKTLVLHESGGTYAAWRGDMLGTVRTQLHERGFRLAGSCGAITLLTREGADAQSHDICGGR